MRAHREVQSLRLYSRAVQKRIGRYQLQRTTPVSSHCNFPEIFRPDLIFLDEALHARGLNSLTPIALFSPVVWVFVGDFRQTRLFVPGSGNTTDNFKNRTSSVVARKITSSRERSQ